MLGFFVNLLCVGLLWDGDCMSRCTAVTSIADHHADHNLLAAYLHLLTDVLTSVLAIVALLSGQFLGWVWMDPLMGIVGALVILQWAWSLLRRTGNVLLDATPAVAEDVRRAVESRSDNKVADLHVWRVGPGHLAAMLTVVTGEPRPPAHYKSLLASIPGLSHVTVEVETPAVRFPVRRANDERRNTHVHAARHR